MSDEDDFSSLLGDDDGEVRRLNLDKRIDISKKDDKDASISLRKWHAQAFTASETDPLDTGTMEMVQPMSLLSFQRPGIQHGVYKNLRLGKYRMDATLDLHRLNVEEARNALYRFVRDCLDNDVRSALITHGKGEGREKPALLKSCVAHWLPQIEEVLAFHTAQKHHGSYGATYVLLRKSDRKKLKNKEKHRQ